MNISKDKQGYRLGAVHLLIPVPLGRLRVAVAHAHHHGFVLLVAVFRVLVGDDVKKSCSTTEAPRSGGTAGATAPTDFMASRRF